MHKLGSFSNGSLYTDVVLFFFSFFSLLPHPYPLALSVNKFPVVFIFYHVRSMDFEEKIEGLWTGYSNGNEDVKKAVGLF